MEVCRDNSGNEGEGEKERKKEDETEGRKGVSKQENKRRKSPWRKLG